MPDASITFVFRASGAREAAGGPSGGAGNEEPAGAVGAGNFGPAGRLGGRGGREGSAIEGARGTG